MYVLFLVNILSPFGFERKHGRDRYEPSLVLDPLVVVGDFGVDSGTVFLSAAFAPTDDPEKEQPLAGFTHQRAPPSHPRRRLGSSRDVPRRTCFR